MHLIAVKDEAGNAFINLETVPTVAVGIRNFAGLCKSKSAFGETVKNNPKDFNLYLMGEYENETGKLEQKNAPQIIAKAEEFIKEEKNG